MTLTYVFFILFFFFEKYNDGRGGFILREHRGFTFFVLLPIEASFL